MAIYMKFGAIKGAVTTKGYTDWIELLSTQMGAGRGIGSARGTGSNREAAEPSISEIVVTKHWDAASSSLLFQEALSGLLNNEVQIDFSTTNKSKQDTYLTLKLWNCGIASYSMSGHGDKPTESLSLNFSKVEITPIKIAANLSPVPGEKVAFDLEKMRANA